MKTIAKKIILLIEDDAADAFFMHWAFGKAGMFHPIYAATRGQESIEYLAGKGKFVNRHEFPLPSLVVLSLHLPDMTGFDVLKWIRNTAPVSTVPVIALTPSAYRLDAETAYRLGATSCFAKPTDPDSFFEFVQSISEYWFQWNMLPIADTEAA